MQTPKSRTDSLRTPQRISPRSISSEISQKSSPRGVSSETLQKDSPRVVRQLKTGPRYCEPTASSSNLATRPVKEKSPKISDRRSPISEKKHPRKISELETQISQLENDLKTVKDQLCYSETSKKQALKDAAESNEQLSGLSTKIEDLQKQIIEQSSSQEADTHGRHETLKSELEALQKQHAHDLAALASALDEIDCLKVTETKNSEAEEAEFRKLKEELEETLSTVEEMRSQLRESKESEVQAQKLVNETLMQLEIAKKTVETLTLDGSKTMESFNVVAIELEKSKARVDALEQLVSKLEAEISCESKTKSNDEDRMEINCLKLEIERLTSALRVAEMSYSDELSRSAEEIRDVSEMLDRIKSESGQREAELEAELRKSKYEIEELKANLMDKETELQGICEENDDLVIQLETAVSGQNENELEKLKAEIEKLNATLLDKDIECEDASQHNETLKLQIKEMRDEKNKIESDFEAAKSAEREALMKARSISEEVDKCNKKIVRVTEQLEAEQASNKEMEGELRRLKVQCDQWRKAAEAATSMLTGGNDGHLIGRTGSLDSSYCPRTRRIGSPYEDELEDDFVKRKNANMLSRFWKKQQKQSKV